MAIGTWVASAPPAAENVTPPLTPTSCISASWRFSFVTVSVTHDTAISPSTSESPVMTTFSFGMLYCPSTAASDTSSPPSSRGSGRSVVNTVARLRRL